MIIYHDVLQGSSAWKLLRKALWTGTTAIRLLQGKPLLEEAEFLGNKYTKRGKILEEVAIREYERQVKHSVSRPGFVTNTVYPNAGYSPDAIDKKILLEVKCFNGVRHDELVRGDIPLTVLVQIYFGMIITGCRKAKLLAFNPECEQQLTVIDITYDKAIGDNIRKKLKLDIKNRQPTIK